MSKFVVSLEKKVFSDVSESFVKMKLAQAKEKYNLEAFRRKYPMLKVHPGNFHVTPYGYTDDDGFELYDIICQIGVFVSGNMSKEQFGKYLYRLGIANEFKILTNTRGGVSGPSTIF